ncbi:hypothetical protein GCM10020258_19750 [Sphingomonas yabuuchiae]
MIEVMAESKAIARAFDAASAYDAHAVVQRQVADWLAERIVAVAPPAPRVLEVGCGTGFLTAATLPRLVNPDWLMTDIAPAMLARGLAKHPGVRGRVMDGEYPDLPGEAPFDLIVSSLAVQWFGDLEAGLRRLAGLLAPGGRMLVTTLVRGPSRRGMGRTARRVMRRESGLSPGRGAGLAGRDPAVRAAARIGGGFHARAPGDRGGDTA